MPGVSVGAAIGVAVCLPGQSGPPLRPVSSKVLSVLRAELSGRDLDLEGAGLSKGEARELREALDIPPPDAGT